MSILLHYFFFNFFIYYFIIFLDPLVRCRTKLDFFPCGFLSLIKPSNYFTYVQTILLVNSKKKNLVNSSAHVCLFSIYKKNVSRKNSFLEKPQNNQFHRKS